MARAALLPEAGRCQGGFLASLGLNTPHTSPCEGMSPPATAMPCTPGGSVQCEELTCLKGCGETLRTPMALRKLCGRTYGQESSVLPGLQHQESSRPLGSALGFSDDVGRDTSILPFPKMSCLAPLSRLGQAYFRQCKAQGTKLLPKSFRCYHRTNRNHF